MTIMHDENVTLDSDTSKKPRSVYMTIMSKKRYNDINNDLMSRYQDETLVNEVMEVIKKVMNFDPDAKAYDPKMKENTRNSRQKRSKELGISSYQYQKKDVEYQKKKLSNSS